MNDIAIKVDNLAKVYRLYDSQMDRLKESLHPLRKKYHHDFYALKDVNFEINKGETIGIIGKNGCGKSTLLQIITGVLTPTTGTVIVNGKIAALLELGAGFNPALTGIENVYFNGALMGFTREEMDDKLDHILSFADIGEFVHQPVKVYSSGMFVRLAFAAAISVDPDVLIIDEALSVGDLSFRNKCMDRVARLHHKGTTVLFVTHDLSTLQMFCDRVVWMDSGQVKEDGNPVSIAQSYSIFMTGHSSSLELGPKQIIPQQDTGMAEFIALSLGGMVPDRPSVFETGQDIKFKFSILAKKSLKEAIFAISVYRSDGDWVLGQTSKEKKVFWTASAPGDRKNGEFVLVGNCLAPGDYHVAFGCYSKDLSLCYAMSEINVTFSVRSKFPTWGKFLHPCSWKET